MEKPTQLSKRFSIRSWTQKSSRRASIASILDIPSPKNPKRASSSSLASWSRPTVPTLPVELWVIILDKVVANAIADAANCYQNCDSNEFPQFLQEWNSELTTQNNFKTFEHFNWRLAELRLVCRLWSTLIDPQCRPLLYADRPSQFVDPYGRKGYYENKDVRGLRIFDTHLRWRGIATAFNKRPGSVDLAGLLGDSRRYSARDSLPKIAQNITNIVVSLPVSQVKSGFPTLLLQHYRSFRALKSLSIQSHSPQDWLDAKFWPRLAKGYQQLTSLRISGCPIHMTQITLPSLKILDIDLRSSYGQPVLGGTFPQLKHLCIRFADEKLAEYVHLFCLSMSSLQSLVLWGPASLNTYDIGDNFPDLLLLGATTTSLQAIDLSFTSLSSSSSLSRSSSRTPSNTSISSDRSTPTPTSTPIPAHTSSPPKHPLHHVWILDSNKGTSTVANRLISKLVGMRRLSIDSTDISLFAIQMIKRRCEKRGIKYIDMA